MADSVIVAPLIESRWYHGSIRRIEDKSSQKDL